MSHVYTLIYPAAPGEESIAGDIRVTFRKLSRADAEYYAETLLKDRGVWASRHAQIRAGNTDDSHVVSVHSTWGGAWIHPHEQLIKREVHQYTAQAYVDGHLTPYAFAAERFSDAQRIALAHFSFETTIWLRNKNSLVARHIPGKGWVRTPH